MESNNYPDEVARKWKSDRDRLIKVLHFTLQHLSGIDYGMKNYSKPEIETIILKVLCEVEDGK